MSDSENGRLDRPIPISTEEFDRKVEVGEDIDDHLDWDHAIMIEQGKFTLETIASFRDSTRVSATQTDEQERAEVSALQICLPQWAFMQLKDEATRQGISQEDLAQLFIIQRLDQQKVSA